MESAKKLNRWSNDEVQVLLSIYAEEEIQRDFQSATRNDRVYAKIAARLSDVNIDRTAKKVREKLKKLKQDYKKIKDHNNRSGSDRWTTKWYDRLDAILGQGPGFSVSVARKDSATVPLEAKCDEPTEIGEQMEDETVLGGIMDAEAGAMLFTPATTSSPRRSVGPTRRGKRKRELFIDALWEIEDSNRAAMQHIYKQRDRYMQHLLDAQVQENELRRRENELRRRELEVMRAEAEESRRLQRDLQDGILAVLRRLADSLS